MIIVSDTTAITNLFQIGKIEILRQLYGQIIIPLSVKNELDVIPNQKLFLERTDWIRVEALNNQSLKNELLEILDLGEAEAIALTIEKNADFLIIDEKMGREIAKDYNISIIGMLGILIEAKEKNKVRFIKPLLDDLIEIARFRISPSLYERVLRQVGEFH